MATKIVPNVRRKPLGSTFHNQENLGSTLHQDQLKSYRLAPEAIFLVHKEAPSWKTGPGCSPISHEAIETKRRSFMAANGNEFGNDL